MQAVGAVRAVVIASAVLLVAACGADGLSDAERRWCVEHHATVLDTMDVLFPWHWEGNEAYKAEALPLFQQVEDGVLDQDEANVRLAELARRYWPAEYVQGCRAAFTDR